MHTQVKTKPITILRWLVLRFDRFWTCLLSSLLNLLWANPHLKEREKLFILNIVRTYNKIHGENSNYSNTLLDLESHSANFQQGIKTHSRVRTLGKLSSNFTPKNTLLTLWNWLFILKNPWKIWLNVLSSYFLV